MTHRWALPIILVVALAVVAAAWGHSRNKTDVSRSVAITKTITSPSGGGNIGTIVTKDHLAGKVGSGLTRGVSGDTIKVGCVYTAAAFAGADDGYRARFERANRDGGVDGRKIAFSGCEDDGENAQQNLQIARRLVEQDHVFAVMSASNALLPATANYLGDNEVPYFGWGFAPGFCGTRWGFGFNGCLVGDALPSQVPHAVVQGSLADLGIKASGLRASKVRVAFQSDDSDPSRFGMEQFETVYKNRGAKVVYARSNMPSPGPPADYTPFVRAVIAAKPNLVVANMPFQETPGFIAALRAAGYTGADMNFVTYIPGLLAKSPQLATALEGAYVATQVVPQEEHTAYTKQIEKDLAAIHAKDGTLITLGAAIAYAQADMLIEQLHAVGKNLNTATFDRKINHGFTFRPKESGGPGRLTFPQGHFLPADCGALLKIENAKYVPVAPFTCYKSVRVR